MVSGPLNLLRRAVAKTDQSLAARLMTCNDVQVSADGASVTLVNMTASRAETVEQAGLEKSGAQKVNNVLSS